jgi:hypothetical protein
MARQPDSFASAPLFNIALRGVQVPHNKRAYNERINGSHASATILLRQALTGMEGVLRKPAVIAAIVATISIATMFLVNHTNLIVDRRPPLTPPGTTFNAVNGAGSQPT